MLDPTEATTSAPRRLQALETVAFDGAVADPDRRSWKRQAQQGHPVSVVTGIDDRARVCVIAKGRGASDRKPVYDALLRGACNPRIPEQILTDNGKMLNDRLVLRPASVLFDRTCLHSGIPALGDVPPVRRFELVGPASLEVIDGDVAIEEEAPPTKKVIAGESIRQGTSASSSTAITLGATLPVKRSRSTSDGPLHISYKASSRRMLVVTSSMTTTRWTGERSRVGPLNRPRRSGAAQGRSARVRSFAGTHYRVGNSDRRQTVGVRLVGDIVQVTLTGPCCARIVLDITVRRSVGALAQPNGKRRKARDGGT